MINSIQNFKIARLTWRTFLSLGGGALVSSCMQPAQIINQEYRILTPDFQDIFDIPPPPDSSTGRKIKLWSTNFYTTQPVEDKNGVPFRDKDGIPISDNVSKRSWCLGAQEGSVKTTFHEEEIRLTHAGVFKKKPPYYIDCDVEYETHTHDLSAYGLSYHVKTNAPFGLGINNYFLVPYRTMAVKVNDNSGLKLKAGDVLYINDVTNNMITDPYTGRKFKHDGYFFVGDVGGKVKDIHADTFCGFQKNCLPPFTSSDDDHHYMFTAVVITDPAIKEKLLRMHLKSSYR